MPTTSKHASGGNAVHDRLREMQMLAEDFCNGIALGEIQERRRRLHVADVQAACDDRCLQAGAGAHRQRPCARHRDGRGDDTGSQRAARHQGADPDQPRSVCRRRDDRRGGAGRVPVCGDLPADDERQSRWWILTASTKRYSVGDSVDATGIIKNAIPFDLGEGPARSVRPQRQRAGHHHAVLRWAADLGTR